MAGRSPLTELVIQEPPGITIKSPAELALMRRAGEVVAATIETLMEIVRPGIKTRDLDDVARKEILSHGAKPSFLGYRGFPATICTSINEEIVHGIPGDRIIKEGDLVKLDVGAIVGGFHADSAVTIGAGILGDAEVALLRVTQQALENAILASQPGSRIGDLGAAVQRYVESEGSFGIVREYVGHGIGRRLHEEPGVPNYGEPGRGPKLRVGMALAIEPMVNLGTHETRLLEDGWTVVTADGSLSAHFEHTLAITENGPEVLTRRKNESRS